MKSIFRTPVLLFFFNLFLAASSPVFGSHSGGGELTYTHLTGNTYLIHCTFYRDCFGIAAPTSLIVNISSTQCGINQNITLAVLPGSGQEITILCPGSFSTCQGGTVPGIQKWEYENTFSFPGQCSDWLLSTAFSPRSNAIITIINPGGGSLYLEARLNNSNGDNNSPKFTVDPNIFICIGQDVVFNNGLVDSDGDSLVYSLISGRTDANTNLSYIAPYSAQQPLTSLPQVSFDSQTGDLFIHPTTNEVGVITFQIQDYRNGILMGSVLRDIIIYSIQCNNSLPVITGVNGTSLSAFNVLPGPFCFDIFSYDADMNDSTTMTWNNGIPGANFTISGNPNPTGVFCWNPTVNDVRPQPYSFTVSVNDNHCPAEGIAVYSFVVTVTLDSSIVGPLQTHGYFSGNIYYDINGNGLRDSIERNLPNRAINVQPDGITAFSNNSGYYRFYSITNGNHTIGITPLSDWVVTTDSTTFTVADDSLNQAGYDFGLNASNLYTEIEVYLSPGFPRCNDIQFYSINYENTGTTLANGRIIFVLDDSTAFISSTPPPNQITGDSLLYDFTNLWPFEPAQINILLQLPGAGNLLNFDLYSQYDSLGSYYTSHEQAFQQIVNCSYDPNDKTVFPSGVGFEHKTLYTDPLLYTIRFQNTGNDTVFTVFIQDFISPALDINTFHITGSSHPMSTTIYPNRMAEFRFENILLPDSLVNETESHGYVQYEILPLTYLSLPSVTSNFATIFFDSNFPVTTNTVSNTLVSEPYVNVPLVGMQDNSTTIFPNPFHDVAEILLGKSFTGVEHQFTLINVYGEIVVTKNTSGNSIRISRGNLSSGIYFYEVKNKNGIRSTGKLIIN